MNLRSMPPLTVVIFDREKDYEPYKLLKPNGTSARVAGQFVRQPSWSMIGMAYGSLNDEGRRTIYGMTEVRAIASQLLALPDLPARLRAHLEQQLQKTN